MCGHRGSFNAIEKVGVRDSLACSNCRSSLRMRDAAQIIIDEFGGGVCLDIKSLVASGRLDGVHIYEVGVRGPLVARFKRLKNYVQSYFWEDAELGSEREGVQCQDLRQLTFPDSSFDLVVSFDVLEHVFNPEKAFSEIRRVLKPGGVHVFTIPVRYPMPANSLKRAEERNGQIFHLEEPRYHVAGDGSRSLVVTDWGEDIFEVHREIGLQLRAIRRSAPAMPDFQNVTMVARRLS